MTSAKLSLTLQPSFDAGRAQQRTRFDLSEQEQSEFAAMQSARSHPFELPNRVRVLEAVQRTLTSYRSSRTMLRPISIALGLILAASLSTAQVHARSFGNTVFDTRWNERTFIAIGAGDTTTLAIDSHGACIGSGNNDDGECVAPALPPGLSYAAIDGGEYHSIALRSDGSLVAWGSNFAGQLNVPALPAGVRYVQVSAADTHCVALRDDGRVVAWGTGNANINAVPVLPPGLSYVKVAAGRYHGLALRSDGSAVAWGETFFGECNVPVLPAVFNTSVSRLVSASPSRCAATGSSCPSVTIASAN